jgi:hypothetical protein
MTEQDKENENMTEIVMDKKSMIEYDNNKKHTYGDEDSNMKIALPEDNPIKNYSSSMKESDNIEGNNLISESKVGTESSDLPTLSETMLSIVDADQVSENDDIRNETDDLTILPDIQSKPNKPTAIVKPCPKSETTFMITEHGIKDIHDGVNSLLKEKKLDNENKEILRKNTRTEKDVKEMKNKLKSVEKETKSLSKDIKDVEENNKQMMTIVEEFEKTINQLVMKKEREEICQQIVMERLWKKIRMLVDNLLYFRTICERDDVVSDHQNVEKAFVDVKDKYERTKQVVEGLQMSEDNLKQSLEVLTTR